MRSAFPQAACLVFGGVVACNGGELDAFTSHGGSASGTGGLAGTSTGGNDNLGGEPGGGEGGNEVNPDRLPIDDFEDGDWFAILNHGQWYVSQDPTGVQNVGIAMPSVELDGSTLSLHASGVGFDRFAGIVCDVSGDAATFNASNYVALSFSARAEAGSAPDILFTFFAGGRAFAVPVALGTEWGGHTILFSDALPAEGGASSFDPRSISAIQLSAPPEVSFDLWIDDLAFVK